MKPMNTCPICMRARMGIMESRLLPGGTVYKFECLTNVTRVDGITLSVNATDVCLAGAQRIHAAAQALYDAFSEDHAHVATEQRLARSEWRKITMDRDGKECAP